MSPKPPAHPHIAVVGGGISGLASAFYLRRELGARALVTVFESSPQVGGKLRVSELAGLPVDEGAESVGSSPTGAVDLIRSLGLADDLVSPGRDGNSLGARLWTRGKLRPLPAGTLMGIPTDLRALAASGVLTPLELARIPLDHALPPLRVTQDVAIGRLVAERLGQAVVDRLLDPLLGGVYAGRADELSLDATLPDLSTPVREERSLLAAVQRAYRTRIQAAVARGARGPGLLGLRGGMGRLPQVVADQSGADIRLRTTVREIQPIPGGFRLVTGPVPDPQSIEVDAVVVAVPAAPAARLLDGLAPRAAADLAVIDYASMAVVSLVYRASEVPPLTGSGFLVPAVEGRAIKAATFASTKWPWLAAMNPDLVVVRTSLGRHGATEDLQRLDHELVELSVKDLASAVGFDAAPIEARVSRWGGGLPQYAIGHRQRVAHIHEDVAKVPGLAVCGAAYDGVGIAACVESAHRAATRVASHCLTSATMRA